MTDPRKDPRREFAVVAGFVCLLFVPFMGKPYHIDEPWFVFVARQFLLHPRHPFDFSFVYWGTSTPYSRLSDHPPLIYGLVALIMKASGGGEWSMRLALLPVDVAGACGLYLLAARFLKRPLLPVLAVIASPAYWLNMNHLMAEKPAVALGLWGLYAMVRGVDDDDPRWFWASAGLLDLALLFKYSAVVFVLPAASYGASRGRRGRLWGWLALCAAGPAAYLGLARAAGLGSLGASLDYISGARGQFWSSWPHKLRSVLAFTGGCGLAATLWPLWGARPKARQTAACIAAAALLFSPWLDAPALVRPVDRLTGITLAAAALWALWCVLRGFPKSRGRILWLSWTVSGLIWVWLYWTVTARMILYLVPPLAFAAAEALESRPERDHVRVLLGSSLAATLALGLALNLVDARYAGIQREFADQVMREHPGRRVWCACVGGLKHYLTAAGALELDKSRGGWEQVRPGDVVVLSKVTDAMKPDRRLLANVKLARVEHPIPLRLISLWTGEGGFYSNAWGFLPFSLSEEPLDEFTVVEVL
ncbi:MAG: glycosyltransferase family 39 protein [Elusimicrobia bacterium]|nr:glycosyltransferase family 39 protein [Elusimicrobiota bacterium]